MKWRSVTPLHYVLCASVTYNCETVITVMSSAAVLFEKTISKDLFHLRKKKARSFFHMYFSVSLTPLWSKLVRAVWNWTFLLHLIDETTPNVLYTGGIRSWKNPANVKELENSQFQVRKKWLWEVMEICITNPRMCFRWHRLRGRYSGSFYSYFSCRHVIIIIIIRFEQYKWTPCAINDSYTSMYAAERDRNYTLASGKI